jgi:hypothetical protein
MVVGLPFTLMTPLLMAGAWASPTLALSLAFSVGVLLCVVAGVALVLGPLLAYRRAQRTVYMITSAGAHVIVEGATRRIETYCGPDLAHIRCVERPDGSGDLVFPRRLVGRSPPDSGGFYGVPSVVQVQRELRRRIAIPAAATRAPPLDPAVFRLVGWIPVLGSVVMLGLIAFIAFLVLRSPP